nr:hypothetical protein [Tanacetum cinerariifolium]GEW08826.1 hypothetical protein [Tanacetum cinerariifolium]
MIVSGQSGTPVGQGSVYRGCEHRLPSAYVLKHPGRSQLISGLSGSSRSRNYTLDEDTYPTFLHDDGTDPTKVKVGKQERVEEEAKLLDSTIGHVVLLLPVASARSKNKLEASVKRLFDEGGSADQVDSAPDGGQEVETGIAMGVRIVAEENVVAERPKHPRKKMQATMDASGSSHPPKKLRGDYGASSEAAICGKSPSTLGELLASSLLSVGFGVAAVPTFHMVTSSVSATPEHESGAPADSITGLNIRTIGASERFVISLDSSRHSSTYASEAEGGFVVRSVVVLPVISEAVVTSHAVNIPPVLEMGVKVTSPVCASLFQDSNSTETYFLSERKRLESECEKQADLLKVSAFEAAKNMHASEIDALK